jgi:3',5'-cyclic AMP phosphodiesterase CpdA
MRIAHITDLHIDSEASLNHFMQSVHELKPEFVINTGDNDNSTDWRVRMKSLPSHFKSYYYVKGNHDFWGGNTFWGRSDIASDTHYIPNSLFVSVTNDTVLVGVDGWYDTGFGTTIPHPSTLNDVRFIGDFVGRSPEMQLRLMRVMGEEQAAFLKEKLLKTIEQSAASNIVVATHVPPFQEVLIKMDDEDDLSAFMGCAAAGRVIRSVADLNPDRNFTVLCGHTHRPYDVYVANNIRCIVGDAGKISFYDCP